ncbi:MAG: BON domain-containing protein [Alphaproteobacteria bacterium]|nr:MAG: BON domain-containing protein [Alphaproteobacteria bacterium]
MSNASRSRFYSNAKNPITQQFYLHLFVPHAYYACMKKNISLFASASVIMFSLTGCLGAIIGGVGSVGQAAVEERSIGTNIDDRTISAAINRYFMQSEVPGVFKDVQIRVHEGRVLLLGKTNNQQIAMEAVRLAWLAGGVREVMNEIQIGSETTGLWDYSKDNVIESQIETRLIATKGINSSNYTVEVVNGVAYLLGVAQDAKERHNAAYIASVTRGVNKVVSYVRLKDDPIRLNATGKMSGEQQPAPPAY